MLTETQLCIKRWLHELDRRRHARHNYTGSNVHQPALNAIFDYEDCTTIMFKMKDLFKRGTRKMSSFFRRKTC